MSVRCGNSDPIGLALSKMLGCPKNVRSLTYRCGVDEVSTVTVEYLPEIEESAGEQIAAIVKRFRIEAIDEPPLKIHIDAIGKDGCKASVETGLNDAIGRDV